MATSGTFTFRTTRDEVIKGALRLVGGYDPENSAGPTATQITIGAEALNLMVKSWATHGQHLWERKYGVIFPQPGQAAFVLGGPGPGGDHACTTNPLGTGFVATTLSASASSGATSITVTDVSTDATAGVSATSITDTYNVGIELDSGAVQWTTVSGAPVNSVVTLAVALTGDAASGNNVFCYQTKLYRPLRVMDGFIRDIVGGTDTPIRTISKDDYNRYGFKSATSTTVQMHYDRRVNVGHLYLYPTLANADKLLYIEFESHIEDFSASGNDYDLPQEWGETLKFNLALRLAPEYEVPEEKFRMIQGLAEATLIQVLGYDQEVPGSVSFGPDYS